MALSVPLLNGRIPAVYPISTPLIWTENGRERRFGDSKHSERSKAKLDGAKGKASQKNRVLMLGSLRELALYRAEVLRSRGFQVQISTNREDALERIRAGGYDAIVLSYTLSDATVRELADEVREYCPQCPVVAISNTRRPDRTIKPDLMVLADEGPAALISALHQVLREQ